MLSPVTVIFVCPKCGAGYHAIQKPWPTISTGNFRCEVCQTNIFTWSDRYVYLDWKAVETLPKPTRPTPPSGRFR